MIVELQEMGIRIMRLRKEHGFSQEDLAKKLGVKRTKVADWEKGRSDPKAHDIKELANIFATTCDMILVGVHPEYTRIHEMTGLSNTAILTLTSLKNDVISPSDPEVNIGTVLSMFLESTKAEGFTTALLDFRNSYKRLLTQKAIIRSMSDNHFKESLTERATLFDLADKFGHITMEPDDALDYYQRKMAECFTSGIVESIKAEEHRMLKAREAAIKMLLKKGTHSRPTDTGTEGD